MDIKNKRILFITAHPDDDVFSSGAFMKHLSKKNKVTSVFVTCSPRGVNQNLSEDQRRKVRYMEGNNACKIVGAKAIFLNLDKPRLVVNKKNEDIVKKLIQQNNPDLIFTHPPYDAHPTHKKVNKLVTKARKRVWYVETWTPLKKPDFFYFFTKKDMKTKVIAMKAHKSQLKRTNFIEAFTSLNKYRGAMGKEMSDFASQTKAGKFVYAEAFEKSKSK